MAENKIIKKGNYIYESSGVPVSVKQYIITESKKGKNLLLRFENLRSDELSAIKFKLTQYNEQGIVISDEDYDIDVAVKGGAQFTPQQPIYLLNECDDFKVDLISSTSGSYSYVASSDGVKTEYAKKKTEKKKNEFVDRTEFYADMHEKRTKVKPRTMRTLSLFLPAILVITFVITLFTGIRIASFTRNRNEFSIDDVEYRFVTGDRETGPIEIVSYNGKADNVVIPDNIDGHKIVGIAENAFSASKIKNLTLNGHDIKIYNSAFANNSYISSVSINGTASIGEYAFANCSNLKDVEINSGVTSIGDRAFYNCTDIGFISLPSTLKTIGESAFEKCESLKSISIPSGIESMGTNFLKSCSSISSLSLPYIGFDQYHKCTLTNLIGPVESRKKLTSLTVTADTEIMDYAFYGERYIEKINYTSKITSIGSNAFENCTKLKSFDIPSTVIYIGEAAFKRCTSLSSINYNANITRVPKEAFRECSSISEISLPDYVLSVEDRAFFGCSGLESVDLSHVEVIGIAILDNASSIKTLKLNKIDENEGLDALGCSSQKLEYIEIKNAEKLPNGFLSGSNKLKTVVLPANLKTIGDKAFYGCGNMTSINIPANVTAIGKEAFSNCSALINISIIGVTELSNSLFSGCSSLETITLNSNLTRVGDSAFAGCSSLKESHLPASVTYVGSGAYYGCSSLSELTLPFAGTAINNSSFKSLFTSYYSESIPKSIKKITILGGNIGSNTFEDCGGIEEIVLSGDTTTSIGSYAFSNCYLLKKITISKTLENIGSNAFSGCDRLYTVIAPSTINISNFSSSKISDNLIRSAASESDVRTTQKSGYTILQGNDGSWYITDVDLDKTSATLDFPERFSYGGSSISSYKIANNLIEPDERNLITDVKLNSAVESIGNRAFYECTNIQNLYSNQYGPLTFIGDEAFYNCSSLRFTTIPAYVTSIGNDAFYGCSNTLAVFNFSSLPLTAGSNSYGAVAQYAYKILSSAPQMAEVKEISGMKIIPAGNIGFVIGKAENSTRTNLSISSISVNGSKLSEIIIVNDAFNGSSSYGYSLQSVSFGSEVTYIGDNAFYGCYNLSSVSFGSGLEYLGDSAFSGCSAITTAILPSGLKNLGSNAFADCTSLEYVTLPSSNSIVIPSGTFQNCSSIKSITIPSNITNIEYDAFRGTNIYEVINRSSLGITAGSTSYGYVAYNAIKVRNDYSSAFSFTEKDYMNFNFLFAKDSSGVYLCKVSIPYSYNYSTIILPEYQSGGVKYQYAISKNALSGLSNRSLVVTDDVSSIDRNASNSTISTIYYEGTSSEWNSLGGNLSYYNIYYYSDCIHPDETSYWTYNSDGYPTREKTARTEEILTAATCTSTGRKSYTCTVCKKVEYVTIPLVSHNLEETVTKPATCTSMGVKLITCTECSYSRNESIPLIAHSIKDGKCEMCGLSATVVTNQNFSSLSIIKNDSNYPFTISDDEVISSTNNRYSTSATLTITANKDMTVSFMYKVSSESYFDFLTIKKNNEQIKRVSGTNGSYESLTISLKAGDNLTFTYSKDGSGDHGDDCAYIKDLVFI